MAAMRILLDAKDLINVVEHSNPVKLSEFDSWLRTSDAELVYSLVNIRGLAAPLALGSSFLPQVKDYLDRLESLPHCFVTSGIDLLELQRALDCFGAGKEYVAINPYVPRFDYVFPPFLNAAKLYYPMRDSVVDLWRARPNVFQPQPKYHKLQALGMSIDRDRMAARQSSSEPPSEWIVEILTLKMNVEEERASQVASWIAANPLRCPGNVAGAGCRVLHVPESELCGAEGRHFRHGRDVDNSLHGRCYRRQVYARFVLACNAKPRT